VRRLAAFVVVLAGLASPAHAVSDVTVWIQDPSTGPNVRVMAIAVDHNTLTPGPVRFHIMNQSKVMTHQVVIVRFGDTGEDLPMRADRVDETKITRAGKANVRAGGTVELQRVLRPGSYLLICNRPGHFHQGMKVVLTVAP
jgi:uncharacterized cupredoxin-like copper-binding protein